MSAKRSQAAKKTAELARALATPFTSKDHIPEEHADLDAATVEQPSSAQAADSQPDEGQFSKLGVALTQLLTVEIVKETRLKISFAAQRPSFRKKEETTMTVMKGILFPLWYPYDAVSKDDWSLDTYLESHLVKDPGVHSFVVELASPAEAEHLKEEIECAAKRLYSAVQFLSLGLPLRASSSVTMVTVDAGGSGDGSIVQ